MGGQSASDALAAELGERSTFLSRFSVQNRKTQRHYIGSQGTLSLAYIIILRKMSHQNSKKKNHVFVNPVMGLSLPFAVANYSQQSTKSITG